MSYSALRNANITRQAEWPGGEHVDLYFRTLELAGEAGELCNLFKKQVRLDRGVTGTVETQEALTLEIRDELGDVNVCLDLVGMEVECPMESEEIFAHSFGRDDLAMLGNRLFAEIGWICQSAEDLMDMGFGTEDFDPSHSHGMQGLLGDALDVLKLVAKVLGHDLDDCTRMKFNATSAKHDLKTRIT